MSTYIIRNRVTDEERVAVSDSFHEACHLFGWLPAECSVTKKMETSEYLKEERKDGNPVV